MQPHPFHQLDFKPYPWLASPHLQILVASFAPSGQEPPTKHVRIPLGKGDYLACEISKPPRWQKEHDTVCLVHGLGGNHLSSYMIRLARKFYELGVRVVRINLRGCGSGQDLSQLPYNSGNSEDIDVVLAKLKADAPLSNIYLIGFSLGGNIVLKLAGEKGVALTPYVHRLMAICPPVDLFKTLMRLIRTNNVFYHRYFVKLLNSQAQKWLKNRSISSLYEFDQIITAPLWGYKDPEDYYLQCSAAKVLAKIQVPCDIVFTEDDPIIDCSFVRKLPLSQTTNVWLSPTGSHMGFIGPAGDEYGVYWMDRFLVSWFLNAKESECSK